MSLATSQDKAVEGPMERYLRLKSEISELSEDLEALAGLVRLALVLRLGHDEQASIIRADDGAGMPPCMVAVRLCLARGRVRERKTAQAPLWQVMKAPETYGATSWMRQGGYEKSSSCSPPHRRRLVI